MGLKLHYLSPSSQMFESSLEPISSPFAHTYASTKGGRCLAGAPASGLDWSLALSELGGLAGIRGEPCPKAGTFAWLTRAFA